MMKAVFGGVGFVLGRSPAAWLLAADSMTTGRQTAPAQFFPRIIAFFTDYAKDADAKLGAIKAQQDKQVQPSPDKSPRIITMTPANGSQNVDPHLKAIVVTFDRRMQDRSWSVVTLGTPELMPKTAGPLRYHATRRVFTLPVQLEPGREYRSGLNGGQYQNFCSTEGIPLTPVVVRFMMRQADSK